MTNTPHRTHHLGSLVPTLYGIGLLQISVQHLLFLQVLEVGNNDTYMND